MCFIRERIFRWFGAETMLRRIAKLSLLLAIFIAAVTNAVGQTFPTRPIQLIVPFAAGGASDTYARLIAQELSTILRQPVNVQNMPGGNSITGTAVAARAIPDGYTLLLITQTHATLETLVSDKPYRLLADFVPVALIGQADLLMIVPQSLPVKNLADFVNLAKARPRGLTFASSGPGSPSHMAGELFKTVSGIDMVHIPYKSAANARADLLAGQLHVMFDAYFPSVEAVKSGQLRALATTGKRRSDTLPDVPTVRESGLEEFEAVLWMGNRSALPHTERHRRKAE